MIYRNTLRSPIGRPSIGRVQAYRCRLPLLKSCERSYSTSTSNALVAPPGSILGTLNSDLEAITGPRFSVDGQQVRIIHNPADFYQALLEKLRNEKKFIYLSTLYIGKDEHELISTIREALNTNPQLKVSVLADALRGTREYPQPSCASLLVPLVAEFGAERVEIRLYHTPNLTGLRKRSIPKRINEGWGLQHMKLYGSSGSVLLSGANLSNDYFTNRQDRYIDFNSTSIAQYYQGIHQQLCRLSFLLTPENTSSSGYTLQWPASNDAPSPLDKPKAYISAAARVLEHQIHTRPNTTSLGKDTSVYPICQMTPITRPKDISTELPAIRKILNSISDAGAMNTTPLRKALQSSWTFTAGYFNPIPELTARLLATPSKDCTVITAHPHANGFFSSAGVSGLLPSAYTLLSRRFLQKVHAKERAKDITLKEWRKGQVGKADGWTYHAKGLWVSLNDEKGACISVIGSSNYTKRSYNLDLEAGAVIVTEDLDLKRRLGEERDNLQAYAKPVGLEEFQKPERRVGLRVRAAMWIVKMVGGAL